jgi:putative oxidoreductase
MNVRKCFSVPERSKFPDIALLLIRVVAGLAFMMHGWGKIQNPFGWMGPDAFAPGIFQALATMSVAFFFHAVMKGDPFVGNGGPSYELAALYFCVALLLIAVGPGRLSVDRQLFGPRSG